MIFHHLAMRKITARRKQAFTNYLITGILKYLKGDSMESDKTNADGYYGEDEAGDDELDLSFLDEDEKK